MNEPYYEQPENLQKAIALAKEQLADGWTRQQVEEYFYMLGLSIFRVKQIRKAIAG